MDYNEIEKSIIQEWKLMNEKDDLTESDVRKIELWITHKEFRDIVVSNSEWVTLLRAYPQLEMLNRKWPIIWFSEFYKVAEGYKDFQKTEYIDRLIKWYTKCMTVKCLSRDAELIRLKNTNEYAKCIAAFEKMKANILPQANIELKPTSKPDLTLPQIALITVYEDTSITRKNGDDIAKKYGHNSGERLFQLFTKYSSRANRIGTETTLKKNLNKIKLFETIISKLTEKAKLKAANDMNILKTAFESEFQ